MIRALSFLLATVALQCQSYTYFLTGNAAGTAAETTPGFLLAGGGKDDEESFRWFLAQAGGGNAVVLRASGADGYQPFFARLGMLDSVETIVFKTGDAAADPFVLERIRNAEAIFLAGGDQGDYVRLWKDTAVMREINAAIKRGVPVGGTSAGLAVLGQYGYSAENGGITSAEALADPFHPKLTLVHDFIDIPRLQCVVTDSHFRVRDRMGRLLSFMARIADEGKCAVIHAVGIDERATVLLRADGTASIGGTGDAYYLELSQRPNLQPGQPASISLIAVTRVASGETFDFEQWAAPKGVRYQLAVDAGKIRITGADSAYGPR